MMNGIDERLLALRLTEEQTTAVKALFAEMVGETVDKIKTMISYWERVVEGDQSLYTLGLRRSIDMIQGTAAYDRLPILETEDTPDE